MKEEEEEKTKEVGGGEISHEGDIFLVLRGELGKSGV